jgi:hypothetical protein
VLQELNPQPDTATNAQILFLVLNASSLTLLPVTIFMYRMQQGAADPTLVFLPILLATSASTLVGLFSVALCSGCPCSVPWCWPICCPWGWRWQPSWRFWPRSARRRWPSCHRWATSRCLR